MGSEEPTVVLGSPKTDHYPVGYIEGSIVTKCERCPTEVVLSPATRSTMKAVGKTVVPCDDCLEQEMAKEDE